MIFAHKMTIFHFAFIYVVFLLANSPGADSFSHLSSLLCRSSLNSIDKSEKLSLLKGFLGSCVTVVFEALFFTD